MNMDKLLVLGCECDYCSSDLLGWRPQEQEHPISHPPCSMTLSSGFVGPHELLLTVEALWCRVRCGQRSPEPGSRCLCCC